MPRLSLPIVEVRRSFVEAMDELRAEGRGAAGDLTTVGHELREESSLWTSDQGFATYVRRLRDDVLESSPRRAGYVPATAWWWIDGDEYLGLIRVRHRLTPQLLENGGHIGYHVRPSARRRGHAAAMLRAVLPEVRALGLERALVTCKAGNLASRRVIESNGGVLEDQRGETLRYWIDVA